MLTELKQGSKVVGVKQTKRAVNDGKPPGFFWQRMPIPG